MAKRRLFALALVLGIVFGTAASASAHVEAVNNGVSSVMHIVPDDNPTAGEPTLIYFSFASTADKFSIIDCGCQLDVSKEGRAVTTAYIEPADQTDSNGQASVTFPAQGVYDFVVRGAAGKRHFSIQYVVRVNPANGAANAAAGLNVIMIGLASLAVIWILAYYNIVRGGRYAAQPAQASK